MGNDQYCINNRPKALIFNDETTIGNYNEQRSLKSLSIDLFYQTIKSYKVKSMSDEDLMMLFKTHQWIDDLKKQESDLYQLLN